MTLLRMVSDYAIPLILLLIPLIGVMRKVKVYEAFTTGAKNGVETAFNIIPYLVAMFVAINVFRASGAMEMFINALAPIGEFFGIPRTVIPMAIVRPLSGSGALGILSDLMKNHGPDSIIGRLASTMMGSTETTFYVLAVYFGAAGVKRVRHSVVVGLVADLVGIIAAVFFIGMMAG